jgi:hypothetical protein
MDLAYLAGTVIVTGHFCLRALPVSVGAVEVASYEGSFASICTMPPTRSRLSQRESVVPTAPVGCHAHPSSPKSVLHLNG